MVRGHGSFHLTAQNNMNKRTVTNSLKEVTQNKNNKYENGQEKSDYGFKTIINKVFRKAKIESLGINFYESSHSDSKHYIYDQRTNALIGVSAKDISIKVSQANVSGLRIKVIVQDDIKFLIIYKNSNFEPQFGILSSVYTQLTNILELCKNAKNAIKTIWTKEFGLFIMDLIRLIIDIRDGWISGSKIVTTLMSLYSLFQRFTDVKRRYESQVYFLNDTTFDSLILTFSLIGVPKYILDIMKVFSEITGRKLYNSNFILSIVSSLYDLFKGFISWMCKVLPNCGEYIKIFESIIDYLFSTIVCYSKIKKVVELYSKYVAEANIILDPKFRNDCEDLYKNLKKDVVFREYIENVDNKHFRATWDGFANNLMKFIDNFDISKRDEPICIVLEGKPGCGKSVLMNNLVEYLVRSNLSVYVHSVPPTEGGKDFYDDYANQDVFVMDDVGQQGVSQWRTIINFVAPVKYPLECAEAKKKNTKFFNSKYIICTTNKFTELNSFTTSDCIAEPGALFRRAHVLKVSKNQDNTKHLVNIDYLKYDYKDSAKFVNEFLYHNSTDSIPTQVEGLSTKESLIYVMKIFKHLIKTEEENRMSSLLSDEDFKDIDDHLNFQAQFKLGDYVNSLRGVFENFDNGLTIFDEWYEFVKNRISGFVENCIGYLVALANPIIREEQKRIFLSTCPYGVLGLSKFSKIGDVEKAYKTLMLKYHPDKHMDGERELYTIISQIIIRAYNSIKNDELFINEPQFYEELSSQDKLSVDIYNFLYSIPYRLWYYYFSMSDEDRIILNIFGVYIGICVSVYVFGWIYNTVTTKKDNIYDYWIHQSENSKDWELGTTGIKDTPATNTVTTSIKKSIRFVVGKRSDGQVFYSQATVGGRFIMMNSHTNADKAVIDIYNTYEHFTNNHKEQESVTILKVKDYPSVDLCVYRMVNISLIYRSPKYLFGGFNLQDQRVAYPFMFLVSSLGIIPIATGARLVPNQEEIKYSTYGVHYVHRPKSGYITDIEGNGLCGSLLVNPHGVIMGVHVAGDGVNGFCVTPSNDIVEDIRKYLCTEANVPYDVDEDIQRNFSGVRLKYDQDAIRISSVGGDVPMVPTPLHRDICPNMRSLIGTIHDDTLNEYSQVLPEDKLINNRKPPNLTDRPLSKLKETSKKTFKLQGFVADDELDYIDECISSLFPESFDDVDFHEAAFGGDLASMAKDTSNGYGHCRTKDMFFDFENKKITDYGLKEIESFKDRVLSGKPEFKDYLSKEVFKVNELRNEEKCDKPRTIRVMPVTHIFWTKVICGNLAKHFKKYMHETGVCIGFNPYKDFDTLARNLRSGAITGDADFGGWDGTLNARVMFKIFDVIKRRYVGSYPEILEFLSTTICRSLVLVGDELYSTTHGMPSGTWLTLLLNCLVNRAITALTIFRNKEKATVDDFLDVISYVTGDDNIFSTPSRLADVFNLFTLRDTAESLGMTCTNGDKSEITEKGQKFHKLNYLKRHFRFHPDLKKYVGCLSLSTILNTLQYVDGTKDYNEAMQGKVNAVAVESYLHSRNLYLLLREFIKENAPDFNFLDESRVVKILSSDEGYTEILQSLGKNYATI